MSENLIDLLARALPFVESALEDAAYKPDSVHTLVEAIRATVEKPQFARSKNDYGEIEFGPCEADPRLSSVLLVDPPKAWTEVLLERRRQVVALGWSADHDDALPLGKLAQAGSVYASNMALPFSDHPPRSWPLPAFWWKPQNARKDLIRAAALIIAEIERIDRMEVRDVVF